MLSYHETAMRARSSRIEVVDEDLAAILRQKSGAERLEIASWMFSSARSMLINHLRWLHPEWDDERIQKEAARRLSHGAV
jgi:hypothetical protein